MFFEQHALEPNIGAAYFWLLLVKGGRELQTHALEDWMERGYAALQVMENHLRSNAYFAANQLTVADIALYGYTHVADRCDYDLSIFPAIRAWLRRVEKTPGFVPWTGGRPKSTMPRRGGLALQSPSFIRDPPDPSRTRAYSCARVAPIIVQSKTAIANVRRPTIRFVTPPRLRPMASAMGRLQRLLRTIRRDRAGPCDHRDDLVALLRWL